MSRIAQLERLLAADEGDADVLYMLAMEHAKAGRAGEAVGYFDRCVRADAGYLYAHYHKAKTLMGTGDREGAAAALRAGLEAARRKGGMEGEKARVEMEALMEEVGG